MMYSAEHIIKNSHKYRLKTKEELIEIYSWNFITGLPRSWGWDSSLLDILGKNISVLLLEGKIKVDDDKTGIFVVQKNYTVQIDPIYINENLSWEKVIKHLSTKLN